MARLSPSKFFVFLYWVNVLLLIFLLFGLFRTNPELNAPTQTVVALVCLFLVLLPIAAKVRSKYRATPQSGVLEDTRVWRVLAVTGTLLLLSLNGFVLAKSVGSKDTHSIAQVTPLYVSASGVERTSLDSKSTAMYYRPENVIDARHDTAWLIPNRVREKYIVLWLRSVTRLVKVGLVPGYAKFDPDKRIDRFVQHRRVKRVRLEFSDGTSQELKFRDNAQFQVMSIHPVRTEFVKIVILDTLEPRGEFPQDVVAISEIALFGDNE